MASSPVVDVAAVLDRPRWSGVQKRVLAICFCLALLEGFDSQAMGYAAPGVAKEFGLGPGALALVFSSALVGMFLGSGAFGLAADRFGRRRVLLVGTLVFGVGTVLIVVAGTSAGSLAALRFLAGIGMGGTIATQLALAAEYSPARIRSTVIMILVGSLGLGSFLGGVVAAALIPAYGWRSIFAVGGILPLVLFVVMAVGLPDSLRFLLTSGRVAEARKLLARVAPDAVVDERVSLVLPEETIRRSPVATLFTDGRAFGTTLVWIAGFMNFLAVYLLLSWLPALFEQAGLSSRTAVAATATFTLGGFVGAIVLGLLIDRRGRANRLLALGYLGSAVFAVVAAVSTHQPPVLFGAIFLAGFGIIGCQGGVNAAAAAMYPTAARGTGVGWASGAGRVGSIIGPTLGGSLLAAGLASTSIIAAAAVPMVLAAIAVAPLGSASRRRAEADSKNPAAPAVEDTNA
ncbi:MFS transporter [Amycolatopsis rhabdoformis]|uniref:MFS transporter n=1 Tax=Amycolatopsis rhabdoformis TaxID=1448059 RepID=A0ABZ1IHG9_9PSEU|nr:MFS transporter [Amycolatopsis rhabdoformis]WSE33598.1 MFS transporter [Amycolatopsis rhabdoformis]